MVDTQLKIAPIGEGLSLKARAYEALKTAIMNMNIYSDDAELRLDDQGLTVVSPVKTWKAAWSEIERFQPETIKMGPRGGNVAVVRVLYRDGFGAAHEATSVPGKVLGIDENFVMPGYGNLENTQLAALLTAFRTRFGDT